MELKNYQKRVMRNLSSYLGFLNEYDMVEAWKQYWEDKGNGADTMEAIWNMRHIYGGVARKQTIPAFNGIYIDKITELNNIICESIEIELK